MTVSTTFGGYLRRQENPRGISGGVKAPEVWAGIDYNGLWIDPDKAINSEGIAFAGVDGSGLWIDPDLSEGKAGIDGSGLWVEV